MVHSDDDGLISPLHVANYHAVILSIIHDKTQGAAIEDYYHKRRSFGLATTSILASKFTLLAA